MGNYSTQSQNNMQKPEIIGQNVGYDPNVSVKSQRLFSSMLNPAGKGTEFDTNQGDASGMNREQRLAANRENTAAAPTPKTPQDNAAAFNRGDPGVRNAASLIVETPKPTGPTAEEQAAAKAKADADAAAAQAAAQQAAAVAASQAQFWANYEASRRMRGIV